MGVAILHVTDHEAKTTKDFTCSITLLLQHMKLLTADLEDVPGQDVEVSVNCDIKTFSWLMAYIKGGKIGQRPALDPSNCLQLLLASHYLQMPSVEALAVSYIAGQLLHLAPTAAVQLCSMDHDLLSKIAQAVLEETLEDLRSSCSPCDNCQQQQQQPQRTNTASVQHALATACQQGEGISNSSSKNAHSHKNISSTTQKLVEKLYKYKLHDLLQHYDTDLLRCRACGQLFSSSSHLQLQCAAQGPATFSRQQRMPLHDADPDWSLQVFLQEQRKLRRTQQHFAHTKAQLTTTHTSNQQLSPTSVAQQDQEGLGCTAGMSWRDLYWFVWGHVVVLYCQCCSSHFPARLLQDCKYHPASALFTSDIEIGQYPCCGAPAWHQDATAAGSGAAGQCCRKAHVPFIPASMNCPAHWHKVKTCDMHTSDGKQSSVGASVARAVHLLQVYEPLISGDTSSRTHLQPQRPESTCAVSNSTSSSNAASRAKGSHLQQQRPALPLLVKMVKGDAVAAPDGKGSRRRRPGPSSAPAGGHSCYQSPDPASGIPCSNTSSRPESPTHLPAVGSNTSSRPESPTHLLGAGSRAQPSALDTNMQLPCLSCSLQQQKPFDIHAAVAAAAASAGRNEHSALTAAASQSHGQISQAVLSGRAEACSKGGCQSTFTGTGINPDQQQLHLAQHNVHVDQACNSHDSDNGSNDGSNDSSSSSDTDSVRDSEDGENAASLDPLSGHVTPLSSVMGAVRAAAEARNKGLGFRSSGTGVTGCWRVDAPLAETFSAGGRRILSRPGLTARPDSSHTSSRPSTATSLLSLKHHHQVLISPHVTRPTTAVSSKVARGATQPQDRAITAATISAAGSKQRHVAPAEAAWESKGGAGDLGISAAVDRTLLLELVQQDDAYRMALLMRKLDSLRIQPPAEVQTGASSKQLHCASQLTHTYVMKSVNGLLFKGIAAQAVKLA